MKITRITPPMFSLEDGQTMNEYELRTLMLEVLKGLKPHGFIVTDEYGVEMLMRKDGKLAGEGDFKGFAIIMDITMDFFLYVQEKQRLKITQ